MLFPYVKYTCSAGAEIEFNSAATAAYVMNQCEICGDDLIQGTFFMRCDCEPLYWDPTTGNPVAYTTPGDDVVLWYSSTIPESTSFLGYHVQNVVRPNQMARTVTQRRGRSGGGILGPLNRGVVRLDFQVLLFACDDPGMEYGYRFLANRLACAQTVGDGSTECSRGTLVYRDTCQDLADVAPSLATIQQGLWTVNDAVLVTGPVWGDDPLPGMRRYVRRVDFSIAGEVVTPVVWGV